MSTLAMKPEGEMTSEQQRRLAFENLLMWTEAVITQRDRLDAARARLRSHAPAAPAFPARPTAEPADLVARALEGRLAIHAFNSERHLFINAAFQLVAYRSWVGKLGIVSNDEFRELDAFARDVDILRDKNEHAIDYFRGKGKRPDEWTHSTETSYTDASATFGNLLGGRLDYVELGKVAERLRDRLHELALLIHRKCGFERRM